MENMKQIPQEVVELIQRDYDTQVEEAMGHLHNRFVAYISEAMLPLPQVIMVLTMLLREATDQALAKYDIGG